MDVNRTGRFVGSGFDSSSKNSIWIPFDHGRNDLYANGTRQGCKEVTSKVDNPRFEFSLDLAPRNNAETASRLCQSDVDDLLFLEAETFRSHSIVKSPGEDNPIVNRDHGPRRPTPLIYS